MKLELHGLSFEYVRAEEGLAHLFGLKWLCIAKSGSFAIVAEDSDRIVRSSAQNAEMVMKEYKIQKENGTVDRPKRMLYVQKHKKNFTNISTLRFRQIRKKVTK